MLKAAGIKIRAPGQGHGNSSQLKFGYRKVEGRVIAHMGEQQIIEAIKDFRADKKWEVEVAPDDGEENIGSYFNMKKDNFSPFRGPFVIDPQLTNRKQLQSILYQMRPSSSRLRGAFLRSPKIQRNIEILGKCLPHEAFFFSVPRVLNHSYTSNTNQEKNIYEG
jgi:hypothetical protein